MVSLTYRQFYPREKGGKAYGIELGALGKTLNMHNWWAGNQLG
jgi:hypothetical protein